MKNKIQTYYIYHIFGKKIGVTRNLNSRVTREQGYKENEYEVLETSDDIDYVSSRELELQSIYGYKVDRQSYKNLTKKQLNQMKLNVTEQTTTFPCPLNKLKGNLMDNLGSPIITDSVSCTLTPRIANWIVENAKTSMFNPDRCYIYNKAFYEFSKTLIIITPPVAPKEVKDEVPNVYDLIRQWADERGIYRNGDTKTQYIKLLEESGELARAILKNDKPEFIDAIGDMVVVLTNLAALEGLKIEDCVTSAYEVIASRKGKMINGTFVKENPSIISQTTFNTNPSNYQLTKTL
jgi:NTP pyrophosphatase (non-canonical NTP hydrolase)